MGDRCTGHCCHHFTLPQSPEELWERYGHWRKQKLPEWKGVPYDFPVYITDIYIIAPMAIHLGEFSESPIDAINPVEYGPGEKRYWYTCKHLVDDNCTIYEHRPVMCRDYPYDTDCNYADCTWDERKAKAKLPIVESGTEA